MCSEEGKRVMLKWAGSGFVGKVNLYEVVDGYSKFRGEGMV